MSLSNLLTVSVEPPDLNCKPDQLANLTWRLDFNFLGFYMNHNKEAKSLTFWKGSEVSQVDRSRAEPCTLNKAPRQL